MRALAIALVALLLLSGALPARADQPDRVRLELSPNVYSFLPIYLAIDRGYFAKQHLDVRVTRLEGASVAALPSLARGDYDIMPMVLGPGFFNAFTEGFAVKIVASVSQSHAGWNDNSWIMVREDDWDSGKIRTLPDLRGKAVDGFNPGGPPNMLMKSALAQAHLTPADLTYTEKLRRVPDAIAAFHNHAIDAVPLFEPFASTLDQQHIAHKWLSYHEIIPWFQETFIAASGGFLQDHPDVVTRFLTAYLQGARDVAQANGHWTPALLHELATWTHVPEATLAAIPGPAYAGQLGTIDLDSIRRQEAFYTSEGLVMKPVDVSNIIDDAPLRKARSAAGVR